MTTTRPATSTDLPLLLDWGKKMYQVEKEFFPLLTYSPAKAKQRYEKQLHDPNFLFLVAQLDEQPVGYLYAHLDWVEYVSTDSPVCEIEVIYLEEHARGTGLSQKLIMAAVKWAQEHGAFEVKAGIFAQNVASVATFTRAGFTPQHVTLVKSI